MKKTEKEIKDVNVKSDSTTNCPPLPPLEDIVINLGFWITMAQKASHMLVQNKLATKPADGVPITDND